MSEENRFHLVQLSAWSWVKTDSGNDTDEPSYDFSPDGRLFNATGDCPYCNSYAVQVAAAAVDEHTGEAKEWACLACGKGGDVLGSFGEGSLFPRHGDDDHYMTLPECIVIQAEG